MISSKLWFPSLDIFNVPSLFTFLVCFYTTFFPVASLFWRVSSLEMILHNLHEMVSSSSCFCSWILVSPGTERIAKIALAITLFMVRCSKPKSLLIMHTLNTTFRQSLPHSCEQIIQLNNHTLLPPLYVFRPLLLPIISVRVLIGLIVHDGRYQL